MDREKRGALTFGIILGLIIVSAIFLFLWGAYLNRGTIRIIGEVPFKVLTIDGKETLCEISPCEIVQKRGLRDLIITKEGYRSLSEEAVVKLWRTVDLEVKFEIIPYIQKTEEFPIIEEEIVYKIIFDDENDIYKLIDSKDAQSRAIVYFQKEIVDPIIFGSDSYALVVDKSKKNSAYKIDIFSKTREKNDNFDFRNIEKGLWSNDGKNFAFSLSDSDYIYVLSGNNLVEQLSLKKENSIYAWKYDNTLLLITNQNLDTEETSTTYDFIEFDPEISSYQQMGSFAEIISLPDLLIPANNGGMIYFKIGEEKFRLILRNF